MRNRPLTALAITTSVALALGSSVLLAGSATAADPIDHIVVDLGTPGNVYNTSNASVLPGWQLPSGSSNDASVTADKKFRISNGQRSPFFSHLGYHTPSLEVTAGETGVGDVNTFDASFTIESSTGAFQPNLNIGVTFDDPAQGSSRYGGHLYFIHDANKLKVVTSSVELSKQLPYTGPIVSANIIWTETVLAELDPTVPHTIRAIVRFVDGPGNDYIEVYADGVSIGTAFTLEGLFESKLLPAASAVGSLGFESGPNSTSTTGLNLIKAVTAPVVSNLRNGFLFSNIDYRSYQIDPVAAIPAPAAEDLPAAPASAEDRDAVLEAPPVVTPDTEIEVVGTGFDPYETIMLTWHSTPQFARWAQADAFGNLRTTVTVPAAFVNGEVHTVQATGQRSNRIVNTQVTISANAAAALAATGPSQQILLGASGVAALLLLAGGGLIMTVMRKRAFL